MSVLQVITDRDRRGAQVFALDLAVGLRELGATVETVALAPGSHGDVLPVRALGRRRFSAGTLRLLRRLASQHDVVVAHGSSTLPASALGLIGMNVPIVYRQISDPEFWAASWSRRLRVAAFLRRTKAVVALTEGISQTLQRQYWIPERPTITVIPNAVPGEKFWAPTGDERLQARAILGLPLDRPVVLFIGALAAEKGPDLAVTACARLPNSVLLVVGDGPDRPQLEALATRVMPNRCHFVGSLDDPSRAYWSADVLILPSRSEAMPAVPIEAGLCGLASVSSDVGAMREIIDHGVTGLLVDSGDVEGLASALSVLIADAERRSAMGSAAARRCSERFTISRVASAWLDLLSGLRAAGQQ